MAVQRYRLQPQSPVLRQQRPRTRRGGRALPCATRREALDLVASERTAQIRQRPARLEERQPVFVDVAHEEHTSREARKQDQRQQNDGKMDR